MTLDSYTRADLFKLQRRLARQGIPDVTVMPYESYLQSTLWKKIRNWVLRRDDFSCVICTRKKTRAPSGEFDVHHRNYDRATLEGRDEAQLVTFCRRCHEKIEHYQNGERRTSLKEKETEYQRLSVLHQRILKEGLPLRIQSSARNGTATHALTYLGPKSYSEFYTLDSLMFHFTMNFFITYHEKLKVPLPFGADKLRQPSGARIIDKATNKSVVRVNCSDGGAVVRVSRGCAFPVQRHLLKVIRKAKPWRVDPSDIQLSVPATHR